FDGERRVARGAERHDARRGDGHLRERTAEEQRIQHRAGEERKGGGHGDDRGAAIDSSVRCTTVSSSRPSISAAGERITRWRSAGSATRLTSSGITKS